MNPPKTSFAHVMQINGYFLLALISALTAWWIWPSHPFWWPLKFASLLSGMTSLAAISAAFKLMRAAHNREKTIKAYMGRGVPPKSAKLATLDDLKRAGMIDDE